MKRGLLVSCLTLAAIGTVPDSVGLAASGAGLDRLSRINHVVVIYQENVSFDHYFANYPHAQNRPGEPRFVAPYPTPQINGLSARLLTHNPNLRQPFRLDRKQALTCDMDHSYTAEQRAYNGGKMDQFAQWTDQGVQPGSTMHYWQYCPWGVVMGYYDGNTVTALWNYALYFAMDDNAHGTTFGPSTPGALNLVAGDTNGVTDVFVHDRISGSTVRISVSSAGAQGNGRSVTPSGSLPVGTVLSTCPLAESTKLRPAA